jgi:chromosome condensin MukBEF complex kleisin-like MukF subunit
MAVQRYRLQIYRDGQKAKVIRDDQKTHEVQEHLELKSDTRLRELLVALAEEAYKERSIGKFDLAAFRLDIYPENPSHHGRLARVTVDSDGRTVVKR